MECQTTFHPPQRKRFLCFAHTQPYPVLRRICTLPDNMRFSQAPSVNSPNEDGHRTKQRLITTLFAQLHKTNLRSLCLITKRTFKQMHSVREMCVKSVLLPWIRVSCVEMKINLLRVGRARATRLAEGILWWFRQSFPLEQRFQDRGSCFLLMYTVKR